MPGLQYMDVPLATELQCLAACLGMTQCYSVNFNQSSGICEYGDYFQSRNKNALMLEDSATHFSHF